MILFIVGCFSALLGATIAKLSLDNNKLKKQLIQAKSEITHLYNEFKSLEEKRSMYQELTDRRIDGTVDYVNSQIKDLSINIERNFVSKVDRRSNTIDYNN